MVNNWGLPDFFLTFTADEVSSTKWQEITQLEKIARFMNEDFNWTSCPVECVVLFHNRFHNFMNTLILRNDGLCGRVKQHVFRYEIQNRGSMHAHVIFWVEKDDVKRVASEISAHIP